MNSILIPLVQGAGAVALALVALAYSLTWSALIEPIERLRSDRARLAAYAGVGCLLVLSAAVVYVTPGVLVRDDLCLIAVGPIAATWAIAAAALGVRGMLQEGAKRFLTVALAIVASVGGVGGVLSAIFARYRAADSLLPVGAFLLALGAIIAIALWVRDERAEPATV